MTTAAIHLVKTFIIARVNYCNSILVGLPIYQLKRIQSVLNAAMQLIYGHIRFDHIMLILRDRLHWLWLSQQIEFKWSSRL